MSERGLSLIDLSRPILDLKVFEGLEVLSIERHEHECIYVSDRCDLTIHISRRAANGLQARTFIGVPGGGNVRIRQDRESNLHDVVQVALERIASLSCGQSSAAIYQFVPNRRCDRAFFAMSAQPPDNRGIRRFRDW